MVIAARQLSVPEPGLRDRKKALRRQVILDHAGRLFNENGFDATTMAQIAAAADVTPPTVFNHFGSKENVLSALLFEGTSRARQLRQTQPRQTNAPFARLLGDLLCDITTSTMRIAGKRVWRYAESANLRHADTEFHADFATSDHALLHVVTDFLADYALVLRNAAAPDPHFLGQVFFDHWSARYFAFIKDNAMSLDHHHTDLRTDTHLLVDLIFEPRFAQTSPLASTGART